MKPYMFKEIPCNGEEHTIRWDRRGHLTLLDHTKEEIAAEFAAAKLGGELGGCFRHLAHWRERGNWTRDDIWKAMPFPTRADPIALARQRTPGWQPYIPKSGWRPYVPKYTEILDVKIRDRIWHAITADAMQCGITAHFSVEFCHRIGGGATYPIPVSRYQSPPWGTWIFRVPIGWLLLRRKRGCVIQDVAPIIDWSSGSKRTSAYLVVDYNEKAKVCTLAFQDADGHLHTKKGVSYEYLYDWRGKWNP